MPVIKKGPQPRHNHPNLVKLLADELRGTQPSRPSADSPIIVEEDQRFGNNLHVTVIWNQWSMVQDKAERGAIILDAYDDAGQKQNLQRITMALGLTPLEATRLGIKY